MFLLPFHILISDPNYNIPNVVTRPTTTTTRRPATVYPMNPSAGDGGHNYYPGNDYNRGGGGYNPPGGYNPGGYVPPGYNGGGGSNDDFYGGRATTKRPKGSGFFSNIQDVIGDELGKYLKNQLINQITGGGGGTPSRTSAGGGGGSSNPLAGLFGGGGGGSSNPLSGLLGGGGGGSGNGGGSSLSSLFGNTDFGSILGGGGGGGGSSSRRTFGLFSENPSAKTPAP